MKAIECSKNQLGMKRMKKGVQRRQKGFDSKDDYILTQVLGLKTLKLENVYFNNVVDLFESVPLTTHLPNSDIKAKCYGQNTKIVHMGAKNLVFSTAARIWAETPRCSEKNLTAALKCCKQRIENPVNLRNEG